MQINREAFFHAGELIEDDFNDSLFHSDMRFDWGCVYGISALHRNNSKTIIRDYDGISLYIWWHAIKSDESHREVPS